MNNVDLKVNLHEKILKLLKSEFVTNVKQREEPGFGIYIPYVIKPLFLLQYIWPEYLTQNTCTKLKVWFLQYVDVKHDVL